MGNRPRRAVSLWLRDGFILATACWSVLIVVTPFLASRPHTSTLESLMILGVYAIGSLICHQLPERSYHLWTAQLPVCARCTGIYFGAVFGAFGSSWARAFAARSDAREARMVAAHLGTSALQIGTVRSRGLLRFGSLRHARVLLGIAAAPTALTLAWECSTGDMPSNAVRAAAGVPIGLVVAWLVVAAADNQVN